MTALIKREYRRYDWKAFGCDCFCYFATLTFIMFVAIFGFFMIDQL